MNAGTKTTAKSTATVTEHRGAPEDRAFHDLLVAQAQRDLSQRLASLMMPAPSALAA